MSLFQRKDHEHLGERDLIFLVLENQFLIHQKLDKIMSTGTDLLAMGDQVLAGQAAEKTSLDAIKAGVATIVAGIPAGGLSADETAALKAKLQAILDGQTANTQEASDDAAAVAAAQPAAPAPAPAASEPAAPATSN